MRPGGSSPSIVGLLVDVVLSSLPAYSCRTQGEAQMNAHIPFGVGSRMCIGFKFAILVRRWVGWQAEC